MEGIEQARKNSGQDRQIKVQMDRRREKERKKERDKEAKRNKEKIG